MASCPHCSEALEGFLTQETHKARLDAKEAENAKLRDVVSKSQDSLSQLATIKAERDEIAASMARLERTSMLKDRGITDPEVISTLELIHNAKNAGLDEPVAFEDFEGWGATEHPLLSSFFVEPEATPEGEAAPRVTTKLPTREPNTGQPPAPTKKMTPAQLSEYLNSEEFNALPREEQSATMEKLQREYS